MGAYIIKVIMVSVMFLMLGVGLGITFAQIIAVARQFRLVVLGVLANFLVVPVLMYLAILWLPLAPEIKIGIMLMAAAPIAPMVPAPFVEKARGDVVYSAGLMVIVALLSVVFTPLILSLSLPESAAGLEIDPIQIVKTLLMVQLIPICLGMVIRHIKPVWAEKLVQFVPKIGQIGLLIGVGLLLAKQARQILSIGLPPYLLMVFLVIVSLFVGDRILIGESIEKRRALAISTAIRNIPLAFLIANENFPGTIVAPVALVFSVFTMLLSIVYGTLMSGANSS
jgi:BASS family bile acid:Na+ symporter